MRQTLQATSPSKKHQKAQLISIPVTRTTLQFVLFLQRLMSKKCCRQFTAMCQPCSQGQPCHLPMDLHRNDTLTSLSAPAVPCLHSTTTLKASAKDIKLIINQSGSVPDLQFFQQRPKKWSYNLIECKNRQQALPSTNNTQLLTEDKEIKKLHLATQQKSPQDSICSGPPLRYWVWWG